MGQYLAEAPEPLNWQLTPSLFYEDLCILSKNRCRELWLLSKVVLFQSTIHQRIRDLDRTWGEIHNSASWYENNDQVRLYNDEFIPAKEQLEFQMYKRCLVSVCNTTKRNAIWGTHMLHRQWQRLLWWKHVCRSLGGSPVSGSSL